VFAVVIGATDPLIFRSDGESCEKRDVVIEGCRKGMKPGGDRSVAIIFLGGYDKLSPFHAANCLVGRRGADSKQRR